jgi:acetolactate decarboxylase
MPTRRHLLHTGLFSGCAACAALATSRFSMAAATEVVAPSRISGAGYELSFVGSQRQTIMTGDRAAHLDLRTLEALTASLRRRSDPRLTSEVTIADSRPSLARVGADRLVHVTESYEAGAPFFVWAEVSTWQTQELPDEIQTYAGLEKFVGEAGGKAGLAGAFPFMIAGRPKLIDFHIVNAAPETVTGVEAHKKIQVPFELHGQDVTLVGFWSNQHQGIFTPMGTNMHVHFQTPDNTASGHVQGLDLAAGMRLSLPKG